MQTADLVVIVVALVLLGPGVAVPFYWPARGGCATRKRGDR